MSLVWSAGLALGWRELIRRAGGPIEVVGADEPAASLVRALNEAAAHVEPPASAAVTWWLGDEGGRRPPGSPAPPVGPSVSIAGSLALHPSFNAPFARSAWPMRARRKWIECFGLWDDPREPGDVWERRCAQVVVHFPRWTDAELAELSEEEEDAAYNALVVELLPADGKTRVVLASSRGATLRETLERLVAHLQDDVAHPMGRLTRAEMLSLPLLEIRHEVVLRDLEGLTVSNEALRGLRLSELRQTIRFCLDEGGAGPVSIPQNPMAPALTRPRRWYDGFSTPLIAVLDRVTGAPLFVAWLEDASAFTEASEPELVARSRGAGP